MPIRAPRKREFRFPKAAPKEHPFAPGKGLEIAFQPKADRLRNFDAMFASLTFPAFPCTPKPKPISREIAR